MNISIALKAFRLVMLATALLFSGAAALKADEGRPVNSTMPLYGKLRPVTVDGVFGLEIEFNGPMITDKELVFKELAADERPFELSWPLEMKVYWKGDRRLRLEPLISAEELEGELEKRNLDFNWKSILSIDGRGLNHVSTASESVDRELGALVFHDTHKKKNGRLYNRLSLRPFAVDFHQSLGNASHTLKFKFNRLMVQGDQVGVETAAGDIPLSITPPLPYKARWQDRRTLSLTLNFTRDELWNTYSDVGYEAALKPGLKNIHGTEFTAPNLKCTFYLMRFGAAGFDQAAMGLDGWAEFDLAFNKPVAADEVRRHLTIDKYVYATEKKAGDKKISLTGAQFQVLPREGENDGTVVKVRVKGVHGEKIRARLKGLKSADGRGHIASAELAGTIDNLLTIGHSSLEIEESYPWRSYFTINIRESLRFDDIEKFIRLDPPLKFTVSPYGQSGGSIQIFADFSPKEDTTITLLRGLRSQRGVLTEDADFTVRVPKDSDRKLMFTGRGRYLSDHNPLLVKLAGRNVEKIRLQAWRVYENNLPTIINVQDYDQETRLRLTRQFSDSILDKESPTQAKTGQTFERLIDLAQVLDEKPKGAYLLKCSPVRPEPGPDDEEDYEDDYYEDRYYDYADYYRNPQRYLPVMISDIGLAAHVSPGRATIWANSLGSAEPVAGALVKFYNQANQVIGEGRTDSGGLFSAALAPSELVFATAEKDGDLNYLLFGARPRSAAAHDDEDQPDYAWYENGDARWYGGDGGYLEVAAEGSAFGPVRDYLTRGYEAFVYMPRDIYKPGETIAAKAFVRDKDLKPPRESFPLMWRVIDPDGRVIGQGRADLSGEGGLDFTAPLPFSGRTGSYTAEISLPGSSAVLGRAKFSVEDFVPPRLAVNIEPEEKTYQGENPEIKLNASARYLFGAPGSDLNWELDAVVFPSAFNPKGWAGFDFSGRPVDFQSTSQRRAGVGRLDQLGQTIISYTHGLEPERLPNKTSIEFVFSAQEDGGRWNAKKARVDYFPRDIILGFKPPREAGVEKPFTFEVAAVRPDGSGADAAELEVRIFKVMTRYYNSYRYGRHYRQSAEELVEKTSALARLDNGRGRLDFTPDSAGTYEVMVSEPESGQYIKKRIEVYGLGRAQETAQAKGPVEISFDRENYRPGDKAQVRIKSPFPGRLWLTVETNEILFSQSLEMKDREIELNLPVDKSIKTTAQVTATVVRPLKGEEKIFRAVGVKPLEIDRSLYKLNVTAEAPQRLKPSGPAKVTITLTDENGRPLKGEASVALVDEGILSLTAFKTPDPWKMFTVGRRLATRFYDLYGQLLPLEDTAVPFLRPGGGDGLGRSGLFSPFKRKEEPLSIFVATVPVGADGRAEVELKLPEYSGRGRLMVAAVSGDRFGSTDRSIQINRDLTVEATLPLALAPGDAFDLPVRVFLAAEASAGPNGRTELNFKTEGPLRLIDGNRADFNLAPGQGETLVLKALAEPTAAESEPVGVGRLIIESQDGDGETFSQTIETVVRPPYPRLTKTTGAQLAQKETELLISSDGFLAGTVSASLTLARGPAAEAARAVGYLRDYPYGCLEQTTSRAWIFAAAGDFQAWPDLEPGQSEHIEMGLKTAVQRLATMQTADGGFASWPGGSEVYEWGTIYAVHFLTEAEKIIDLPKGLKDRAMGWVANYLSAGYGHLSDDAAYILSTRAYALYVLALNGDYRDGWVNALKERYDGLSPSARIFLAGAQSLNQGNAEALKELNKMDLSYNTLRRRHSSLDSQARNTALKLLVWSEVDPLGQTTAELARLVAGQGRAGQWSNTQENGLAVLALGRYLTKSGLGLEYKATLKDANGQVIFAAAHNEVAAAGPDKLAPVLDSPLSLFLEGEGRPFYNLTVAGVPLSPPQPLAEGLKISRWWILEDGRRFELNRPEDMAELMTVVKGDRVKVELEVRSDEPIQNVVIVDLLPGGFEIENPRLTPPAEAGEAEEAEEPEIQSRLEMREDRLVIIEPWIERGPAKYVYTLRAVTAGRFVLPATTAEGMYEPDRKAYLSGGQVEVVIAPAVE